MIPNMTAIKNYRYFNKKYSTELRASIKRGTLFIKRLSSKALSTATSDRSGVTDDSLNSFNQTAPEVEASDKVDGLRKLGNRPASMVMMVDINEHEEICAKSPLIHKRTCGNKRLIFKQMADEKAKRPSMLDY